MTNDTAGPRTHELSWRIPAIDGVRALAMLMVYTYHAWEYGACPAVWVHLFGHRINLLGAFETFPAGVDLFMVLSGFCLFLPLCKSSGTAARWNVKEYFKRRARRIVPPYYAAIIYCVLLPELLVVIFRLIGQPAKWQPIPSAWQFLTHLLFIHTFFVDTWAGISGVFWSLGLEAQFYLVFPLVVFGFRRWDTRFIWLMIGSSILYRVLVAWLLPPHTGFWVPGFLYSIFFLGRWMQFALGMAAALIVARHWKSGDRIGSTPGSIACVAAVGIYGLAVSDFVTGITLFPLRDLMLAVCFAGALVMLCVSRTPLRALFENRAVTNLGFVSYSFFLIHHSTAYYLSEIARRFHVGGTGRFMLLCSVGFAFVLAVSYLFFLLFERPFLNVARTREPLVPGSGLRPTDALTVQDQAVP